MRFNLRIKHVHRGLLLGTGPLVDPGYQSEILIPLHNLTDQEYYISSDEGLIWVEFTKTSAAVDGQPLPSKSLNITFPLPGNTQKNFEAHLFRASGGYPIRSSLSTALEETKRAAEAADQRSRLLQRIGIVTVATIVISVSALLTSMLSLISGVNGRLEALAEKIGKLEPHDDTGGKSVNQAGSLK